MIRILRYIITTVLWQLFFNQIPRIDFLTLINNFRVQQLTVPFRNLFNSFWDLILNRVPMNNIFRYLPVIPIVNFNTLTDTTPKRFFWLGFISTLLIYKQYLLFKRFLLWPFKLGIFSFIFSTLGIDTSWFLGLFNIFPLNIPQWVYIQYLNLYNNWLSWWHNTGQIKNLSKVSVNKIPSVNKSLEAFDLNEDTLTDNSESKIFNRTNLYILLGVLTLLGIGIWYYYYNNGTGGGNNNIPPAGGLPPVNPTDTVAGFTEAQRVEQLDIIERLRLAGRISMTEYDHLRERFLPPLPAYQGPTVDPTIESIETVAESSNTQPLRSTTRSSPTHPDPNLAKEYNRLFQLPEGSTPGASGSGIERSNTPPIETTSSNSSGIERSTTPPILPEASSSSSSSEVVSRPVSPTGSTDSSETITSYTDSKGKQKVMITRRD